MNKHLIVIGIVVLLLVVGLSGCNEQSNQGDNQQSSSTNLTDYVRISNDKMTKGNWEFIIRGTITNIAGKDIDSVTIKGFFKDDSNNIVQTYSTTVSLLFTGESKTFDIMARHSSDPYYNTITNYRLEITSVIFHEFVQDQG